MKKLILSLVLIPFFIYGQVTTSSVLHGSDGLELYFVGTTIDSGANNSTQFSNIYADWVEYNADWDTYDIGYEFSLDTLAANDEIVGIFVEGKTQVGTWNKVDTLLASDTLNAAHSGLTGFGLTQLNQNDFGSFPDYRVAFNATHASGNTFTAKLSLFLRKRN